MHSVILVFCACFLALVFAQSDYVTTVPPTFYESATLDPQNMDFDKVNNMFLAHNCWINDKHINYYKFRMYTPATYPVSVPGDVTKTPTIPINVLYVLSRNQTFQGVIENQMPILRNYTSDGEAYSDFVRIAWVTGLSANYVANTIKSLGDILATSGAQITMSSIYVNLPVVPQNSTLQDYAQKGLNKAPLLPVMVWWRGREIRTYVFETTSQEFAAWATPRTRTSTLAGYAISVNNFVQNDRVAAIPLWHMNQYTKGVTPHVNNGGPSAAGQRNIINLDRDSAGYSPLWQLFWVTKVPANHSRDQVSNSNMLTEANGFKVAAAPMYVNCPDIGPLGGTTVNGLKFGSFSKLKIAPTDKVSIQGSLVMEAGKKTMLFVGSREVSTATTGMMGDYAFEVTGQQLGSGDVTYMVKDDKGTVLQSDTITVTGSANAASSLKSFWSLAILVAVLIASIF